MIVKNDFKKKSPKAKRIKGQIGDLPVDITIPNSKVPSNEMAKDILLLILYARATEAVVYKDNFVGLKYNSSHQELLDELQEKQMNMVQSTAAPILIGVLQSVCLSLVSYLSVKTGLQKSGK